MRLSFSLFTVANAISLQYEFPTQSLGNFRFTPDGDFEPAPFIRWLKYKDPPAFIEEDKK